MIKVCCMEDCSQLDLFQPLPASLGDGAWIPGTGGEGSVAQPPLYPVVGYSEWPPGFILA